jgi:hypothetical protein
MKFGLLLFSLVTVFSVSNAQAKNSRPNEIVASVGDNEYRCSYQGGPLAKMYRGDYLSLETSVDPESKVLTVSVDEIELQVGANCNRLSKDEPNVYCNKNAQGIPQIIWTNVTERENFKIYDINRRTNKIKFKMGGVRYSCVVDPNY